MSKAKLLSILVFLGLVTERIDSPPNYVPDIWTPASLFDWYTERLPALRISLFEITCVCLIFITRSKKPVARPVTQAMQASLITFVLLILYGQATGGVSAPIYTIVRAWFSGFVVGLAAMRVFNTAEDFDRVSSLVVTAAIWRSLLAIAYYLKVRDLPWDQFPAHMTTHEDSVLFSVGTTILVTRAIELRTKKAIRNLVVGGALLLVAMKVNNRRLVWIAVLGSLILVYFILPATTKVARRINRALRVLAPGLILYIMIGWGRPEPAFAPVKTISTMVSAKQKDGTVDLSTKARDNENMGMLTMLLERPMAGTGIGHEWVLLDTSGAVPLDVFPLYKFCPHNSTLSIFAFGGALGFAGIWMVIAVAVYLNCRTYRVSKDPTERTIAIASLGSILAYLNQAFGDMGLIHVMPSMLLGISFASAAKLSGTSGAWPATASKRQ